MRTWAGVAAILALAGAMVGEAGLPRLVVLDLPYARVWAAAVQAMQGYPVEHAADGVIRSGRIERAPHPDETGVERVAERVTLRVESFGVGSTRVTVEVEAQGQRDGAWVSLPASEVTARGILDRLRAALG